jgi:dipeptidyl-peptidase 4
VEVVIEERLNTYVEHQTPRRLANGDLIWWSERDGWAHLYRIAPDGSRGGPPHRGPLACERGPTSTRTGVRVPPRERPGGGEDPYYQHLYRVRTTAALELLNPGDFDHRSNLSPTTASS